MEKVYLHHNAHDILEILQANQIQQYILDDSVFGDHELNFNTKIFDWRDQNNLPEIDSLYIHLNAYFSLNKSKETWMQVLCPEEEKTVESLCEFIALNKPAQPLNPIKLFGKECYTASVYRNFIQKLKSKGINTNQIRPSSTLESLFSIYGSTIIEEINLIDPKVLPAIDYRPNSFYKLGSQLFLVSIILTICLAVIKSNMAFFSFAISILSCVMMYIGSRLKPQKATFHNSETLADVIRKVKLKTA